MAEARSLAHQFPRSQSQAVSEAHSRNQGWTRQPLLYVQHIADAWVRAFAHIEGGQEVTPDVFASIVFQETVQAITTNVSGPLGDIFYRTQVEEALRKTKAVSAPGPDGISIDLFRLASVWSAIQLTILYLKTMLHIANPIQYRGGSLFDFYKGKDHHWDMAMYRSILLADSIGKVSARARRRASVHCFQQKLGMTLQCNAEVSQG